MKTADVDILIVPGWSGSGADHWQSRWLAKLKTARLVEQEDWLHPDRDRWAGRILAAAAESARPPVVVAHSLGVAAVVHAAARMPKGLLAGAFLVAPADVDNARHWPRTAGYTFREDSGFAPLPMARLPFPSLLVASSEDPYCAPDRAEAMSAAWGAGYVDAGAAGHINVDSGHGPWPEGLLRFGAFLQKLG
jgi:predicted alpha/beta hydrolase family esterase